MNYDYIDISGIIAGFLSFLAFIIYYISIFRGKSTPNRATWLILTIVGLLIAASYYSIGARETMWVAVIYAIGPFITFLLSIKYGEGGWVLLDKVCLILSGISILIWSFSGIPMLTLLINIFIDFLGVLPTIKKSYLRPYSEDALTWIFVCIASVLNLIAVREWNFSIYIYPVYMFIFNTLIMLFVITPKLRNRLER